MGVRTIHEEDAASANDFSLVVGGPLYGLYLRTRLAKAPLARLTLR
jgi:hypothetical protein